MNDLCSMRHTDKAMLIALDPKWNDRVQVTILIMDAGDKALAKC